VDDDFIEDVKGKVRDAAQALHQSNMPAAPAPAKCHKCDYRGLCAAGIAAASQTNS
jgi:radical SAM protein with 4Fe4S-binding SPASM domain